MRLSVASCASPFVRNHRQFWIAHFCATVGLAFFATSVPAKTLDFEIKDGEVVPAEDFALKVTVLGTAIGLEDEPWPVTLEVQVGSEIYEPFGPAHKPLDGDINDQDEPKQFVIEGRFDPYRAIQMTAISWRQKSKKGGNRNHDYFVVYSRNSQDQSPYVKILRNGDPVPQVPVFEHESTLVDFLEDHVDVATGTIRLDKHQFICLFELGTSDLDSVYADFQDLAVLVTLAKTPDELKAESPKGGLQLTTVLE